MKIIEPFVFLMNLAFFIYSPVHQQLLFNKICTVTYKLTSEICANVKEKNHIVQKDVSYFSLLMSLVQFFPLSIVPFFISRALKKYSHEKLLLLPCISFISIVTISLIYSTFDSLDFSYLVALYLIPASFGGYSSLKILTTSYLTIVAKTSERESRLLYLESIILFGVFIAGIMSGFLVFKFGFDVTLIISASLILVSLIYTLFISPPSLPNSEIKVCQQKTNFSFKNLISKFKDINSASYLHLSIYWVIFAHFLMSFAEFGSFRIIVIYSMRETFKFNSKNIGYLLGLNSLITALGGVFFIPILSKTFKLPSFLICFIAIVPQFGYYLMMALASQGYHLYIATLFTLIHNVYRPATYNLIAKLYNEESKNMLFAILSVISGAGNGIGSILSNLLYSHTIEYFPGLIFIVYGLISVIGSLILSIIVFKMRNSSEYTETILINDSDFKSVDSSNRY